MKKLLFIIPGLSTGGAEKVLITLLRNIDYSRFDVELLLIFNVGVYFDQIPEQVKLSFVYPKPNSLRQKIDFSVYYKLNLVFFERISVRMALKSSKYDAIISFLEGRALKAHSYITNLARKNITWVHTDLDKNHYTNDISMKNVLERKAYAKMDEVVFVSNEAKVQFDKLGYSVKNETIVHNPLEKDFIQSFICQSKNQTFTIVLCGRLAKVKAYDRMIRVAKRLKDDGLQFQVHFIGDGREREYLQELITSLSLTDNVKLMGFKNPPYFEMAKADLFVSTSIAEGYPINICEAICLGLPIVATRCAGTTEILNEGDDFALLAEQNEDSIYSCVKRMMLDDDLRNECRNKTLKAAERFNIQKTMREIYQLL